MTSEEDVVAVWSSAHRRPTGASTCWSTTPGSGSAQPMDQIQTKHLDMQLGVNLRALIIGTREALPMLKRGGRRARQGADRQHGLDRRQDRAGVALGLRRDEGGGDQLLGGDAEGARAGGDPVHGAGAGLRRHADDRVRQGPGQGGGDDPARGPGGGGPLPAADVALLLRAGDRVHCGRARPSTRRSVAAPGPRRADARLCVGGDVASKRSTPRGSRERRRRGRRSRTRKTSRGGGCGRGAVLIGGAAGDPAAAADAVGDLDAATRRRIRR